MPSTEVNSPGPSQVKLADYAPDEILRISDFYQPWDHQIAFHQSPAKYRLQVGGFGSGKSRPLLMEAVAHAMEYPGSTSIILRKTIPDLKRTVIEKFKVQIPKNLYEYGSQEEGTYNETDHLVYCNPQWVQKWEVDLTTGASRYIFDEHGRPVMWKQQSKIYFAACEKESDITKFLSTEYVFIGFEELGEFPFYIWDAFAGRNRCPIPGTRPSMAGATNPMGIGWAWIKRMWVNRLPAYGMDPELFNQNDYEYFHSTVEQNPIYREDKEYIAQLKRSPLRDRIYYGKLDAVSGQYFENFEPTRHVRKKKDFIFEAWQPVWVGWDYGFGHFACITFWTKAVLKPRYEGEKPKLVNVTIKELVLEKKIVEEQAALLIDAIPKVFDENGVMIGFQWDIDAIFFSWERFIQSTKNRAGDVISIADQANDVLREAGLPLVSRSSTNRVAGWTKMFSMLDADEWFILEEECPVLAEAMPLLVRGDGVKCDLEDVVKPKTVSLQDDIADSARYAVAGFLLEPGEKPREVKLKEKLDQIRDPMARQVVAYKEWLSFNNQAKKPVGVSVPSWVNRIRPQK